MMNDIAHHTWIEGARKNSVKPLSISSRGGDAKVRGVLDDDKDYTIDELHNIAENLIRIHNECIS
jgi:hypothetical protein